MDTLAIKSLKLVFVDSSTGTHMEEFDDLEDEMEEENIDDEDDEKVWIFNE